MTPLDLLWLFFILSSLQPAQNRQKKRIARLRAGDLNRNGASTRADDRRSNRDFIDTAIL